VRLASQYTYVAMLQAMHVNIALAANGSMLMLAGNIRKHTNSSNAVHAINTAALASVYIKKIVFSFFMIVKLWE